MRTHSTDKSSVLIALDLIEPSPKSKDIIGIDKYGNVFLSFHGRSGRYWQRQDFKLTDFPEPFDRISIDKRGNEV